MAERYRIKLKDEATWKILINGDWETKPMTEAIKEAIKDKSSELYIEDAREYLRGNPQESVIRDLFKYASYRDKNSPYHKYDQGTLNDIAKCEKTPIDILEKIYNMDDPYLNDGSIAKNPNTPINILKELYERYGEDNSFLAQNPNCPLDILVKLAKSKDYYTKANAKANPSFPKELLNTRKKKPKKTLSERIVVETGSYGLPVNVHLIGNVDKAYKSMKNSQYGFGSPDGAYTDVYIQEAINPEDEDIDCYVGFYPEDVGYSDDDLVQRYIDKGQDDKAVARIKRLAKQNGEEIYWCAGTWNDPWSEALGGYEIDSPEAFEN